MIKEIKVKTALSPTHLPGLDYALNPYRGCTHACVYCYAPSVIHWDKGKWGELVEVKINLPRILSKELRVKKKGVVGLGTVTDPYQPSEKKYEITRRCLELLLLHDFPVCIQTKSSLVLRDIDLLKEFKNVEVGITLTALDDTLGEKMEPGASSVSERLRALFELREIGIKTSDCVKTQLLSQPQIPKSTNNRFIYSEKQLFHSFPINQTHFFLHSPQISPNLTKKTSNLG